MRSAGQRFEVHRRLEPETVGTWVLGFGLIALLGLEGGGYDTLIYSQIGIAAWWLLLLGFAAGILPRRGLSVPALVAIALLLLFAACTALSLLWTESAGRTGTELARVITYAGIFALPLLTGISRRSQVLVSAVAAAIALLGLVALLSRLHPSWFPAADQTARLLTESKERLSYPLNYWNGLGALLAIGMPLLLHVSTSARSLLLRCAAAAALPALALALFFTLSRSGIAAALIAVLLFLALAGDRVPKALTVLAVAGGSALLVALAAAQDPLREGLLTSLARDQGDEMLLFTVLVCLAVGLVQAAITLAMSESRRPHWTRPSRPQALVLLAIGLVAVVVAAAALDAPGRASDAVDEFRSGSNAGPGTSRLGSFAGESRYALWESAVGAFQSAPLVGTGSGTFEFWWNRDGGGTESVQDAHSLYLQTLAELGLVGTLPLLAFLTLLFGWGLRRIAAADAAVRPVLSAAIAACTAFCLSAAVDWTWQIPVLPAALLLVGSTLVAVGPSPPALPRWGPLALRVAGVVLAVVAVVAIAMPYAAADLLRQSQMEVRSGDLDAALADARSATNVQPSAAAPRLQEALVLELMGRLRPAAGAAAAAVERESTNWQNWLVVSRIEAKRGRTGPAIEAFREARSLKPLAPVFDR